MCWVWSTRKITARCLSVSPLKKGYLHDPRKKPYFWEEVDGDDERLLPRVHRVASLLKHWYYGTYQGRVHKQNLQSYLDEFVFRSSGSGGTFKAQA
jgi:hypothetical protein